MSDPREDLICEALETANDLNQAVLAAARLLMQCSCQKHRKTEALAAIDLADNATRKWKSVMDRMLEYARRRTN